MTIELKFHFPVSILSKESDLILTAAEHPTYSTAIGERVDAATVTEARSLWKDLFAPPDPSATPPTPPPSGSAAAQKSSAGTVGDLTARQKRLLAAYTPLAAKARKSARLAFKGQTVKLHDEFRVTSKPPRGIDAIITDARLLVSAIRNPAHAADLKSKGAYVKKDADELAAAVEALAASETDQEGAKSDAIGATDARNSKLNRLYDITVLIQNAARNEFNDRQSQSDFRLNQFPPARTSKPNSEPPTPPTGSAPTPPTS